jgi:hypothetical protein
MSQEILVGAVSAILAAIMPFAIIGFTRSMRKNKLIADLVLGDEARGILPMRKLIERRTEQIQPDTNGGKSLTDLHVKVDRFADRLAQVEHAVGLPPQAPPS